MEKKEGQNPQTKNQKSTVEDKHMATEGPKTLSKKVKTEAETETETENEVDTEVETETETEVETETENEVDTEVEIKEKAEVDNHEQEVASELETKADETPEPIASEPIKEPVEEEEIVKSTEGKSEEEQPGVEDSDGMTEKYSAMSRDALVDVIEALVEHDDVSHIRKHIGFVKVAYRKLLREENMASYEMQLSKEKTDNQELEVNPVIDPLTERFDRAFAVYKEKKILHDKALEQQMQDNLGEKETILEELRQLIDSEEELKKTYDQFNELQDRWRAVGPVPRGSKNTLWNNYHFLVEKFFDKVNINKELKDLDLKKNLEAKTDLCEKAEELLLETSITKSFQQLQKLHEAWKETGPVPKDKKDEIWERFRAATEKLNKRRQDHYESLREEQNKNYAAKLVLCEKADELISVIPDTPRKWQEKTNQINDLFKIWKTIGFAPKKVNNEVWNRFRGALDTFFSNKKEFFRKYKDQQKENYNEKLNLCLQAEALKDSEDWRGTTDALINLQNEWKKIGPVPTKFSDKIWKRFRQACDHFFNRKSTHFANIGNHQNQNLKEKKELIEEIKNHNYSDDNKENLEILKGFQRKWMEIGHVPIKHKDKMQGEFRKTIDNQFDILNISQKAKSTLSFRTKIENIKNTKNADNIIQKERIFLTNKIKNLEADIQVLENNIGFFASSKKAYILKAEFEEKIDKARNEIGILKEKMRILRNS